MLTAATLSHTVCPRTGWGNRKTSTFMFDWSQISLQNVITEGSTTQADSGEQEEQMQLTDKAKRKLRITRMRAKGPNLERKVI